MRRIYVLFGHNNHLKKLNTSPLPIMRWVSEVKSSLGIYCFVPSDLLTTDKPLTSNVQVDGGIVEFVRACPRSSVAPLHGFDKVVEVKSGCVVSWGTFDTVPLLVSMTLFAHNLGAVFPRHGVVAVKRAVEVALQLNLFSNVHVFWRFGGDFDQESGCKQSEKSASSFEI